MKAGDTSVKSMSASLAGNLGKDLGRGHLYRGPEGQVGVRPDKTILGTGSTNILVSNLFKTKTSQDCIDVSDFLLLFLFFVGGR